MTHLGKQETRYRCFLNPYSDVRFTSCPQCGQRMRQRKLPLVIHVAPDVLFALNKTCKYCPTCDLLLAHQDEIEWLLAQAAADRGRQPPTADEYLIVGTMDRPDWKAGMENALPPRQLLDHVYDFREVVTVTLDYGWRPDT